MHVLCDEGYNFFSLQGIDVISADLLNKLIKLWNIRIIPLFYITFTDVFQVAFRDVGPHYAVYNQNNLARVAMDPLDSLRFALHVFLVGNSSDWFQCLFHWLLSTFKPLLHLTSKNAVF